jgi:MFS family permease
MTETSSLSDSVPWRLQIAVYGIGMFSTSMFYMAAIVVGFWVASIETSALLIGIVLGSRHFLPLFLSIHGGALMDRLGGRRVMVFFAIIGVLTPLLFPVMPWIWAALILQMIAGLVDAMGWLGAQVLIGQHMRGSTLYTGRLSYTCRFGHLFAPPLIGWVWDVGGPSWAFFGLSLWGLGMLACALMLPPAKQEAVKADSPTTETRSRLAFRDLLPRLSDYTESFRLLAVPAIALVVMASMLSHVGASVHSSFYVIYLGDIGFTGAQIGWLLSASSFAAVFGALAANWASKRIKPYWLMMGAILASVLAIAVTPALGLVSPLIVSGLGAVNFAIAPVLGLLALLMVASAIRGASNGITQPMVISTVLRAVGAEMRGKAAGLRGTANRVASIVSPIVMGGVAEMVGIVNSFYIVGAIATVLMAALAVHVMRSPLLSESNVVTMKDS